MQRGLWGNPSDATRQALESQFLSAEAALEARTEESESIQPGVPGQCIGPCSA
jgi:hypothetical protein